MDVHTLALTSMTYDDITGEIFDADVEINSANNLITTGDTNIGADLVSIVTHEAGHFLGLAHSEKATATMFGNYSPGDPFMRDLDPDDVAAICAAYPQGRPVASSSCEPRRGFTKQCSDELSTGGCGCYIASPEDQGTRSRHQRLPLTTSGFSLIGTAFVLWIRRKRRSARLHDQTTSPAVGCCFSSSWLPAQTRRHTLSSGDARRASHLHPGGP